MRAVLSVRRDELKIRSSIFFFPEPLTNERRAARWLVRHASDLIILRATSALSFCVYASDRANTCARASERNIAPPLITIKNKNRDSFPPVFKSSRARGGSRKRKSRRGTERYNFISLSWISRPQQFSIFHLDFSALPFIYYDIIFANSDLHLILM